MRATSLQQVYNKCVDAKLFGNLLCAAKSKKNAHTHRETDTQNHRWKDGQTQRREGGGKDEEKT